MKKLIFLAGILLLAGCGDRTVDVNGAKMTYEELTTEIERSEAALEKTNADLEAKEKEFAELEKSFEDRKNDFEALEELRKNRDSVASKVKEAEKKLGLLELDVEETQAELDVLKGEVVKTAEEPLKVGAGLFYFGKDIEPGRYKAVAQEGYRGIMFVRSSGERGSKASSALGSEDGNKDYVFEAVVDDELETTMPIYLYPVE